MEAHLQLAPSPQAAAAVRAPPVPWRDPHSVAPEELAGYIVLLEQACQENPQSADLRTCLGMVYAMNFEAYKSMDALELARSLEPDHFFAQFKYSELLYRLRALDRAGQETERALQLARNGWEMALARKQLQEIRRLKREGTQKPAWTKPLLAPAAALLLLFCVLSLLAVLR